MTLHELLSSDPWIVLPGTPYSTMYVLAWLDDTIDTLRIPRDSAEDVHVYRSNRAGVPVWTHHGTEAECLAEYAKLPAPMAPDAPVDPLDSAADRDADRSM